VNNNGNGMDEYHVVSDTGAFALIPEWVVYADISDRAFRLYSRLARYADARGLAWPSRLRLASELKCSPSSLDRAVTELRDIGAVTVSARHDEGGQRSNLYTLIRLKPADAAGAETVDIRPSLADAAGVEGVWGDPSSPVTTPPSHGWRPPLVTGDEQNESQLNETQMNDSTPTVLRPPSSNGETPRAKVKRQLPEDFELTPSMREWAAATVPGVDVDAEFPQFCDYHRANANTKANWVLAWRTWMRNAKKWGSGSQRSWNVDKTHRNPANTLHEREGGSRTIQRPKSWD
jgi:hypothetical protein